MPEWRSHLRKNSFATTQEKSQNDWLRAAMRKIGALKFSSFRRIGFTSQPADLLYDNA